MTDDWSRRHVLGLGAAGALSALVGGSVGGAVGRVTAPPGRPAGTAPVDPGAVEPFFGTHQAGIATPQQAQVVLLAFTLRPGSTKEGLLRLLRAWTGSASALAEGRPAPGDPMPELAGPPHRLTATIGLGARALALAGADPEVAAPLPPFPVDRLEPHWSGGDVLVQLCADDRLPVDHAAAVLSADAEPFLLPAWRQAGFVSTATADGAPRNLMGQVEGTANPPPGSTAFDDTVWVGDDGPGWLRGGSVLVVRRIRMDLAAWRRLDRVGQERVIGRSLADGAALGQARVQDPPDFELLAVQPHSHTHATGTGHTHAPTQVGLAIPENAHIRLAHPSFNGGVQLFRRGYNYADSGPAGSTEHGLLFLAFQRDRERFVTVQTALARADALNAWTSPVGSAVFAVLPGCHPDGWVGETLA